MCPDAEGCHQDRPERHHDHEIQHVAELDAGQRQQEETFGTGRKRGGHGLGLNGGEGGKDTRLGWRSVDWTALSRDESSNQSG